MMFKNKLKRSLAVLLAFLLAFASSATVYAVVTYDSKTDPVVALSGMVQYVSDALAPIEEKISGILTRLSTVEALISTLVDSPNDNVDLQSFQKIVARLDDLEKTVDTLKTENSALQKELDEAKINHNEQIGELENNYKNLLAQVTAITTSVAELSTKISNLQYEMKRIDERIPDISKISTELKALEAKVNQLMEGDGEIERLDEQIKSLRQEFNEALEKNSTYRVVHLEYGDTLYADGADDTVVAILRSGSAVVVSPFNDIGTAQGIDDLSDGCELLNGADILVYHNILIPRGGNDGRGIHITSYDGAYLMVGGAYKIVKK